MYEAAETLEDCAMRSRKEALDLAKQSKVAQILNDKKKAKHLKDETELSEKEEKKY